jgi:hypothetical protein
LSVRLGDILTFKPFVFDIGCRRHIIFYLSLFIPVPSYLGLLKAYNILCKIDLSVRLGDILTSKPFVFDIGCRRHIIFYLLLFIPVPSYLLGLLKVYNILCKIDLSVRLGDILTSKSFVFDIGYRRHIIFYLSLFILIPSYLCYRPVLT